MNENVLLVDDDYDVISAYQRNMRNLFKIKTASSGMEALEMIKELPPFAVIVSDYNMPQMNGIEFLTTAKKICPDTIRIMLTGFTNIETSLEAVNEGNVFRFLTKPLNTEALIRAIKDGIEQYRLLASEKELLENTLKGSIRILIEILSAVSPIAFAQANNIRFISKGIAERLGISNTWEVEIAALLSQIGCVTIPTDILVKKNEGKDLSPQEQRIFRSHPEFGKELLGNIPRLEPVAEAIGLQYRNFDGSNSFGDDLKENNIPLIARILRVATDYAELQKSSESSFSAFQKMQKNAKFYDPKVFDALYEELGNIPTNRIVRNIPFKKLRIGMMLADDLRDEKQFVLIPKGHEITDVLLMRLLHISKFRSIMEPIKVYDDNG